MRELQKTNFILFGVDCTGKTTLACQLAEDLQIDYIKRTHPKDQNEYNLAMQDYMEMAMQNSGKVYDRHFVDELACGPVYRNNCMLNYVTQTCLESLYKNNTIYIYCYDDIETIWQRILNRGDEKLKDKDTLIKLHNMYSIIANDIERRNTMIRYKIGDDIYKLINDIRGVKSGT